MIVVDRPGCGATPMVPLEDRLRVSSELMMSVMEHLDVKPRHILSTSAGIYHTLFLLVNYPTFFPSPPSLILISPWSPHSANNQSAWGRFALSMVPNKVFTTQHITMPYLVKIERFTGTLFNSSSRAVHAPTNWLKRVSSSSSAGGRGGVIIDSAGLPIPSTDEAVGSLEEDRKEDQAGVEKRERDEAKIWRKAVSELSTTYIHAEECQGIGQELLLCLNRGPFNSSQRWFVDTISALSRQLYERRMEMNVDIWFGHKDGLVSRKAQLWLALVFSWLEGFKFTVHDVKDGDHTDLLERDEGILEALTLIIARENNPKPVLLAGIASICNDVKYGPGPGA